MGFEPTCNSLVTRLGGCYVSLPYIYIYIFFLRDSQVGGRRKNKIAQSYKF